MSELYSRPIGAEARAKLVDFVEAYLVTVSRVEVDQWADIAKQRAVEALGTDLDVLLFVTLIMTMHSSVGLMFMEATANGALPAREAACMLVELFEKAVVIDKQRRTP